MNTFPSTQLSSPLTWCTELSFRYVVIGFLASDKSVILISIYLHNWGQFCFFQVSHPTTYLIRIWVDMYSCPPRVCPFSVHKDPQRFCASFWGACGTHRVWGAPPATTCLLPYPTPPQRLKSWKNDQADGRVRPPSIPIFTSSQILDAQSPSSYISFFQFYEACVHYHIYLFDYIWGIWFQPWQRKTKFSLSLPDVIQESFVND